MVCRSQAFDDDGATIRGMNATEYLDERGLASAVLSQQGHDFTAVNVHGDLVKCSRATKALGDLMKEQPVWQGGRLRIYIHAAAACVTML